MKKINSIIISTLLISSLILSGCSKSSENENSIDSVKLANNQRIVTAQITSILGNEMAYTVVEEYNANEQTTTGSNTDKENTTMSSDTNQKATESSDTNQKATESNDTNEKVNIGSEASVSETTQSDDDLQQPQMPDMDEMPQGEMPQGEIPSNAQMPGSGEIPSGDEGETGRSFGEKGTGSSNRGNKTGQTNRTMYTKTDETGETLIPVGTVVTTLLGTETTFSRLATNDVIKMIVETDGDGNETVVGIWIVA